MGNALLGHCTPGLRVVRENRRDKADGGGSVVMNLSTNAGAIGSLMAPGKSGLHVHGEGVRVISIEPWKQIRASRHVEVCSGSLRPLVELCVDPAGFSGRCTGCQCPYVLCLQTQVYYIVLRFFTN